MDVDIASRKRRENHITTNLKLESSREITVRSKSSKESTSKKNEKIYDLRAVGETAWPPPFATAGESQ